MALSKYGIILSSNIWVLSIWRMFTNGLLPTKTGAVTWGWLVLHDSAGIYAYMHVIFQSQRFSLSPTTKCSKGHWELTSSNRAVQPWDTFINYLNLSSSSERTALCWMPVSGPLKSLLTACSHSLWSLLLLFNNLLPVIGLSWSHFRK